MSSKESWSERVERLTKAKQRDLFFGRPDKPFHKNECCCEECLNWIEAHQIPKEPADG